MLTSVDEAFSFHYPALYRPYSPWDHMRSTTKAKLDHAIRLQWLKRAGVAAGVLVLIAGGLWYTGLDASVHNKSVKGVIETIAPAAGMTSQVVETAVSVSIKLLDGREAKVIALKTSEPKVGQTVEIMEHIHGTGRSTFSWK